MHNLNSLALDARPIFLLPPSEHFAVRLAILVVDVELCLFLIGLNIQDRDSPLVVVRVSLASLRSTLVLFLIQSPR